MAGDISQLANCDTIQPPLDPTATEAALRRLKAEGCIQLHRIQPPPRLPHVQLTATGAARAEHARQRWENRVHRDRAARNALLAWLHAQRATPQGPVPLAGFLHAPQSVIDGHFLTADDLAAAAGYLYQKSLITGLPADDTPITAGLTADGTDCIEQGGDVANYLTPKPSGPTYNFGPVSGTNIAVGDHATQHATIHGIDADNLRTLMQAITQAIPSLGLNSHDQEEADQTTQQIAAEIETHQPDHARLRAALKKIGATLANAGNQALAAILTAAINQERAKLGLPPGA